MAENLFDKEKERQILSRLASGWSKLSKFTLQYFADVVRVTRANLFTQISDPEGGKRMGVEALQRAAFSTGVKIDPAGHWTLINGFAQQWPWKDATEDQRVAIKGYLKELHAQLRSPGPFRITKIRIIKNEFYQMNREYALIEIRDIAGNEMTSMLFAETVEEVKEAVGVLMDSGVCVVTGEEITVDAETAIQWAHGPAPKPKTAPSLTDLDWNRWIPLVHELHLLGRKPEDIARAFGVNLNDGPTQVPQSTGFTSPPDPSQVHWTW